MYQKLSIISFTVAICLGVTHAYAVTEPAHKPNSVAPKTTAANPGKAAEQKKLSPSNLTVAQIVEKNTAARGGLKNWRAVKSMSMTGKMDAGQPVKKTSANTTQRIPKTRTERIEMALAAEKARSEPGTQVQLPFTLELMRPVKSRLEVQFQGETAVQVYDGEKGWKIRPFLGRQDIESFTAEEIKLAAMQAELDGFLIDHAAKGYKVNVLGMEPVAGKNAYKLKITMKEGQVRHVWVDAQNFLEVKMDQTRHLGGKDRAVETYLSEYKNVNGLKIPFVLETRVTGTHSAQPEKIYVDTVTINPKLDDARFTRPQQLSMLNTP